MTPLEILRELLTELEEVLEMTGGDKHPLVEMVEDHVATAQTELNRWEMGQLGRKAG